MTAAPTAPTLPGRREWAGLAMLALPTLLLAIDNSVLFLALPHLDADLRPTSSQQLWIADIYGFVMAGFLVTMGGIGDKIGHRRLLLIGAAAFGIASVLAAYSVSATMLIVTRALLGLAGAALMPPSLALISTMFRDPAKRGFAIAVWMSCFMAGAAIGPVVGGFLLEWFSWGSVFLMGVPIMVLVLVTAPILLPEQRGDRTARVDVLSAALSVAALLPVIYGLKEITSDGPSWSTVLSVAAGAVLGVLFVRRQRRLTNPLLDLRLFRSRSFTAALAILVFGMVLQGGIYLLVSQYLQTVAGLSAMRAGLWLVSPALALVAGSLLSPMLARRGGPGTVIGTGLVIAVAGFLLVALVEPAAGLALLITGTTVAFLGTAPIGALGIDLIVGAAPPQRAGSASSVAETGGELGIALGIAVQGSIAAAVARGHPGSPGEAFTAGLTTAAIISAVIAASLAALAVTMLRQA